MKILPSRSKAVSIMALVSMFGTGESFAQSMDPRSKVDLIDQPGVVIIRGSIEIGTIIVPRQGEIKIGCKEAIVPSQSKHERGITIEIHQGAPPVEFSSTSVIDYDEVDGFVNGFDQVRKLKPGTSKLGGSVATYTTRDRLTVSATEKSDGSVEFALMSVGRSLAGVELAEEQRDNLRAMIIKAKARLDGAKTGK